MSTSTSTSNQSNSNPLATTDGQTAFFRSVIRYRPRGCNRHFSMIGICRELERELHAVIPSDELWSLLGSCYNLEVLAEMDPDDPDEIEQFSKPPGDPSWEARFQEFQLPIHAMIPAEQSFLSLVNERRLETAGSSPSTSAASISPRSTSVKTSDGPSNRRQSEALPEQPSATTNEIEGRPEDRANEEPIESDLTEQEDYDDDDNEEEEEEEDEDEDDDSSVPEEPKSRPAKSRKLRSDSPVGRSRSSTRARANRARARGRRKR